MAQVADFNWTAIIAAIHNAETNADGLVMFTSRCADLSTIVCSMHEQRAATLHVDMPTQQHAKKLTEEEERCLSESRARKEFIINETTWREDGFFVVNVDDHKLLSDALDHTVKNLPKVPAQ